MWHRDSDFLVGMVWCYPGQNGGGVCTWPPEAATSSGGGVCTERQTSKSEPVYLPSSVADKISPNLALSERLSEVSSAILARRRRRKLRDRSVLKPFLAMVGSFLALRPRGHPRAADQLILLHNSDPKVTKSWRKT